MEILIIAQHLFPIKTPRAHRVTELVKEFSRLGHKVTVYAVIGKYNYSEFEKKYNVTVKPIPVYFQIIPFTSDGDGRRHFIDKVLGRLFGKLFEFPYIEFLFRIPQIIKRESTFDALISVSDPHHVHWGCAKAKKAFPANFPKKWIADSGDPFMDNDNITTHLKYYSKFEREFCKMADYITVPIQDAINGYYPEFADKIKIIPQGFQFDFPIPNTQIKNEIVTFAYAGIFQKDYRNPKSFIHFLLKLDLEFKFVVYTQFKDLIIKFKPILGHRLEIYDPIERSELMEQLKKMDFLLNIENVNCPNQMPSKLIDYAITGRPILSINPSNLNEDLIKSFFARDYSNSLFIENIEQYHINAVANKFITLLS